MAGHANRKQYMQVFGVLTVLTLVEVGAVYLHLDKKTLVTVLVLLAVTKAAIVGLFYMHLKAETKVLKASVAIPMSLPALYAFILIAEGAWRRLPW
ncbi:MAG TPA: cytochrome C oxidase subunit IV family protein [Polyangiaceae bacterium]|nr:cytochrome C oxidase subunit IV family protein [Polyangiaceae bacterium]